MKNKWGSVFRKRIQSIMETNKFNVRELSSDEESQINGGFFWVPLLLIAIEKVVDDWDNFKNGIAGKPEVAK
jgi:hypothetical protein